jgi:thiamine-monophosphate kinase
MGASPAWALLALTLPDADPVFVEGFAEGFARLAQPHRLALVGGDTTRGPLSISVAVHGFVPPGQALTRAGARVGDLVLVTGTLGDAAAGLHALQRPLREDDSRASLRDFLIARLNRPTPRLAAGTALRGQATACIDISDGLLADLGHICSASGVGAEIDAALLHFALSGGDDYELCFTVPPQRLAEVQANLSRLGCGVTKIGRIVDGDSVRVRGTDNAWLATDHRGWEHFA